MGEKRDILPNYIIGLVLVLFIVLSCDAKEENSPSKNKAISIQDTEYRESILKNEWVGYYFKKKKIGYLHELIREKGKSYEVSGNGIINLSIQGKSEQTEVSYKTVLNKDLGLENFLYKLSSSGREIITQGVKEGEKLIVKVHSAGETREIIENLPANIYSANSVGLYLIKRGFREEDNFQLKVFFEPLRKVSDLKIEVLGREKIKTDRTEIEAFKVRQTFEGLSSTGWYEPGGKMIREISYEGFEAVSETEQMAKSFGNAPMDMAELVSLIKVKTSKEIKNPEKVKRLKICLRNIKDKGIALENQRQRILKEESIDKEDGKSYQIILEVSKEDFYAGKSAQIPINKYNLYLKATPLIQADNPDIKKIAMDISNGEKNAYKFSKKALEWMRNNIDRKLVENFSALDTLRSKEGECQSNSYLYTAFLRASKIPCRLVAGIVYSSEFRGFMYHAWCEAFLGEWVDIDPTFGQIPADATHIVFLQGEWDEQLRLLQLLGKLEVDILEIEYDKM